MRIISSTEVAAVSGGGWGDVIGALEDLLGIGGGSNPSPPSCQPYSNNNGPSSVTQTCGANGSSTLTTISPGIITIQTTTPAPSGSGSVGFGRFGGSGSYNGAPTVTTTTCMNGRCNTITSH